MMLLPFSPISVFRASLARIALLILITIFSATSKISKADSPELISLSLEELLQIKISVASRTEARQAYQPASITVIYRDEIENTAARTLNDVLNLYVPGYFRAEDKDDTIASFRGIAPDNNSKVLFLLDGIKVNADWFWGPPDSILNGIDLAYIERIEVIRGPGSVTLGQGAQLGVINVITRKSDDENEVMFSLGTQDWQQLSIRGATNQKSNYFNWYQAHVL